MWPRDWSSDVCSSDLGGALYAAGADESLISKLISNLGEAGLDDGSTSVSSEDGTVAVRIGAPSSGKLSDHKHFDDALHNLDSAHFAMFKIGRASCRERVLLLLSAAILDMIEAVDDDRSSSRNPC